ncbi:bifunctional riboflavin kinase/FAD synthetase [bacterium]|nr:bifunctional riboflavin kinase/FAD synthetase [bacterium]
MRVYDTTDLSREIASPLVVTIGNLDGVHLGHQTLLRKVVDVAKNLNAKPGAITFIPHPLKVLLSNPDIKLLTTLDDKQRLVEQLGIEFLIRMKFDEALAKTSARDFMTKHLFRDLDLVALVIGHDYSLGRNQEGNFAFLQAIGNELGKEIIMVPPVKYKGITVSSTKIRECLVNGHIELANGLLGREYTITGTVQKCTGRGHVLGFPTANLEDISTLLPQNGVYVTELQVDGQQPLPSATNIGHHPTFYTETPTVEAHIIDNEVELYDQTVRLSFFKRIRAERRFRKRERLIRQICSDVDTARDFFRARRSFLDNGKASAEPRSISSLNNSIRPK